MPEEIYVSTDIEADGPIPGPHSMLSLASVALRADKSVVDEFSVNLQPLPGAAPNPRTMLWWEGHKDALAKARENPEDPATAMPRYAKWVQGLPGRVVLVGQPAAFRNLRAVGGLLVSASRGTGKASVSNVTITNDARDSSAQTVGLLNPWGAAPFVVREVGGSDEPTVRAMLDAVEPNVFQFEAKAGSSYRVTAAEAGGAKGGAS